MVVLDQCGHTTDYRCSDAAANADALPSRRGSSTLCALICAHKGFSMIVKELDPFSSQDPILKAGRAAEERMAFYLRRAFVTDPQLLVLNGLRLEKDGDAAQRLVI